jgi:hypothetical protein
LLVNIFGKLADYYATFSADFRRRSGGRLLDIYRPRRCEGKKEPAPTTTEAPTEPLTADPPAIQFPSVLADTDITAPITSTLETLQALFEPGGADEFSALLATAPDGVTGDTIGHRLYLRRHFDRAACFFGQEALSDLKDPTSLNNFSAMLAKTEADDPDLYPIEWLATAQLANTHTMELNPDVAAYHNNPSAVSLQMGQAEVAATAGRRAIELAPVEAPYWTNLAGALEAAGDPDGADTAFARLCFAAQQSTHSDHNRPTASDPAQFAIGPAIHLQGELRL